MARTDFVPIILINAEASKVSQRLRITLGADAEVFAHVRTNTVFVKANAKTTEKARDICNRFDVTGSMHVIALTHADAHSVEPILNAILRLVACWDGDLDPAFVVADGRRNDLIVVANKRSLRQVRSLLCWLDFPFGTP